MSRSERLDSAIWWLKQGFHLLPCQPNSKHIVSGFGVNQARIKDDGAAARWWGNSSRANLCAVATVGFYWLDFDDPEVYHIWSRANHSAALSLTERTPNDGYHVALIGTPPAGMRFIPGVELKPAVIVAPSVVDGRQYQPLGPREILAADPVAVLSSLSLPGSATPRFLEVNQARLKRAAAAAESSVVARIKERFTIIGVLHTYRPDLRLTGNGRVLSGLCPFHADRKPSFYVIPDKGVFGCHSSKCGVRGDVINLYAMLEGLEVKEAIKRMAEMVNHG